MQGDSRIQITHSPNLDEIDRAFVEKTLTKTYEKVAKFMGQEAAMKVVYKQLKTSGLRHKTEVRITLQGLGPHLNANASDWKVRLATTEACKILESEARRRHESRTK